MLKLVNWLKKTLAKKPESQKEVAPDPESVIQLHYVDGKLDTIIDWTETLDPKIMGHLLGILQTGEMFNFIVNSFISICDNPEIQMEQFKKDTLEAMSEHIQQYQNNKLKEIGAHLPVIPPIMAMSHLMNMFQHQYNHGDDED